MPIRLRTVRAKLTALVALSGTWVLTLALRQPQGGGSLGETLLSLLPKREGLT